MVFINVNFTKMNLICIACLALLEIPDDLKYSFKFFVNVIVTENWPDEKGIRLGPVFGDLDIFVPRESWFGFVKSNASQKDIKSAFEFTNQEQGKILSRNFISFLDASRFICNSG